MRVLLDTHALLWIVTDSPHLSDSARKAAANPEVVKLVSIASLWEIAIKVRLKKLDLGMEFETLVGVIEGQTLAVFLQITPAHIVRLRHLGMHHRDPFDRMLVAQALAENLTLISADTSFDPYGVQRLW
jgi:PIN domain nuclease of toxin-antitoxin system